MARAAPLRALPGAKPASFRSCSLSVFFMRFSSSACWAVEEDLLTTDRNCCSSVDLSLKVLSDADSLGVWPFVTFIHVSGLRWPTSSEPPIWRAWTRRWVSFPATSFCSFEGEYARTSPTESDTLMTFGSGSWRMASGRNRHWLRTCSRKFCSGNTARQPRWVLLAKSQDTGSSAKALARPMWTLTSSDPRNSCRQFGHRADMPSHWKMHSAQNIWWQQGASTALLTMWWHTGHNIVLMAKGTILSGERGRPSSPDLCWVVARPSNSSNEQSLPSSVSSTRVSRDFSLSTTAPTLSGKTGALGWLSSAAAAGWSTGVTWMGEGLDSCVYFTKLIFFFFCGLPLMLWGSDGGLQTKQLVQCGLHSCISPHPPPRSA